MPQLKIIVLGSAAGGGFPQWNCLCPCCRLAWEGDPRVRPRTQASLAVSADGRRWILLNASPDLRSQIASTPALQPHETLRGSPVEAIVLTGGEVDQIAGLLHLRERQAFAIYGTAATLGILAENSIFGVLAADVVPRHEVALETPFRLHGMEAELFAVPGKIPLYRERGEPPTAAETGDNVGVELWAGSDRLLFVPGASAFTASLAARFDRASLIFFDGTLFTDDEMIHSGSGTKSGRRMGHMPIDDPGGSLSALAGLSARRLYIHINNTNPILIDGSPERRRVESAGIEVAEDGMEITL